MAQTDDTGPAKPSLVDEYSDFIDAYHGPDVAALTDPDPDAGREDAPRQDALEVAWATLHDYDGDLADGLLRAPASHLDALEDALWDRHGLGATRPPVRVVDLPERRTFRVGQQRSTHLGGFIAIRGEVVTVETPGPLVTEAAFECQKCGTATHLPMQTSEGTQIYGDLPKPTECAGCEDGNPGFVFLRGASSIDDHQKLVVIPQDTTMDDPPGLIVMLRGELVGRVGTDDQVTVTGIYETFAGQSETTLGTFLAANALADVTAAEADSVAADELREDVLAFVEDHEQDGDEWGTERARIVDHFESQGIREAEVVDALAALEADGEVLENNGRYAPI